MLNRYKEYLVPLALTLAIALLFLGAPGGGAFDWSDAPRHALNGVFIKDFLAAAPFHDPAGFAYDYYAQYPALTILFYPPLFYVTSAPFYAIFGVSHATALLVVALHYIAFGWGSWRLFRFWLAPWQAGFAALILLTSPEIASWGRQVMLEIPAFAFIMWSAVFFIRYNREQKPYLLYLTAIFIILAMYTKLSACFMVPVFAATLLCENRKMLLRDRHLWIVGLVSMISLMPLVVITLKFGQANVQSVTGIADATASRKTLAGWLWYLRQIPGQLGWTVSAIAAVALLGALFRRSSVGLSRQDCMFWLLWLILGYLFFSAIDLKEARHSIFILPPLVFAASLFLTRILPARLAPVGLALLAIATIAHTLIFRPVQYVKGYAEAAAYIAHHAPRQSAVLFSGYRDGSFIFNMRAREDRRDLSVVRADKILLNVAVRRELGVIQKELSEAEIAQKINQLGIHYVVAQPRFWNDLAVMQRFEHVLASSQFKEVARIKTPANYLAHETELVIYENLGAVANTAADHVIELPIIGRTIHAGH